MTIQKKALENSINVMTMTAAQTAKFAYECEELSREATVLLFAKLVMASQGKEYQLKYTDETHQLVRSGLCTRNGELLELSSITAQHMEMCIDVMIESAGETLMPQDEPTSIKDLGHNMVKGRSWFGKKSQTAEAERVMRRTPFAISHHVQKLATANVHRLSEEDALVEALALIQGRKEQFFYPISFDYRGRMYYRGGMLNPQGSDLNKALHMFAVETEIGKHGRAAICMAMADAVGIKSPKAQAVSEVLALDLEAYANGDMLEEKKGTVKGFVAAGLAHELLALADWEVMGWPRETFKSGIVCHQDATCSGLQIAAAITGHRDTAIATNCTASSKTETRQDVYGDVSNICAASSTQIGEYCRTYGRNVVKYAVMVLGYGAGKNTIIRTVGDYLKDAGAIDGDPADWIMDDESQKVLFGALDEKCGATTGLMRQLQSVATSSSIKGEEELTWLTADGFNAVQAKTEGFLMEVGDFQLELDVEFSAEKQETAIAPNMVHSIDACQMRRAILLLGKETPVAAIHDSLGTRPSEYWEAAVAVRKAFVEACPRETVEAFMSKYDVELELLGDYEPEEAASSSYFWC